MPHGVSRLQWITVVIRLTHWSQGKLQPFRRQHFQMHLLMKMYEFRLNISLKLVPLVRIKNIPALVQIMATDQATGHYLNQWCLVNWCIYASLGLNELTHWPLREATWILNLYFSIICQGYWSWAFHVKLPSDECHKHHWWLVNVGSGNGLVPSGNKPLPEPMLTQFCITIWHH